MVRNPNFKCSKIRTTLIFTQLYIYAYILSLYDKKYVPVNTIIRFKSYNNFNILDRKSIKLSFKKKKNKTYRQIISTGMVWILLIGYKLLIPLKIR